MLGQNFQESESTIGVEFGFIEIGEIEENVHLTIQLWDTSGAERYKAITMSHMRNSDGVILVYDISNQSSFEKMGYWLKSVRQVIKDNVSIYLYGNKLDLVQSNKSNRRVMKENVIRFMNENQIDDWVECSAKTNENLLPLFIKFYRTVYGKQRNSIENRINTITTLYQNTVGNYHKSKSCC